MIDRDVFARLMRAVSNRINKPLGEDASAMYYATLSEELTTEEFQRGMAGIFRDHAFATWPAPAEIIDRAKPARKLEAAAAWTALEEAMKRCVPTEPVLAQLRLCGVPEVTLTTFLAIGGMARWRMLNNWQAEHMRGEFLEHYAHMQRLAPAEQAALAGAPPARERITSGKPQPIARLLPGVAPYSPGDSEHD